MCLVCHAFGGEILLIVSISCILANWIKCCSRRFLTRPRIIPTSPVPFDKKAEVVEHLVTCDGTEDLSAMILLSVMRKLRTISTTTTNLMIPPCSFWPKIVKEKAEVIEHMEVQRYNKKKKKRNTWSITTSGDTETFLCSFLCFVMHLVCLV